MRIKLSLLFIITIITFNSCSKDEPFVPFFSISNDRALGAQVAAEIASKPSEYPILDSASNAAAYQYLYAIRNQILNSGKVVYKDDFSWRLRIIKDDTTLNAFCTPGGYIYVYTGIIKYLESKDQLAGVLGHEMAHADRRHTSRSMQTQYGVQLLLDIALGKDLAAVSQIASGMLQLKNSREHEKEADEYSVKYLCPTSYNAAGAAGFFMKLEASGIQCGGVQQFFSTHPCPDNRIANITSLKVSEGCTGTGTFDAEYTNFKNLIP